MIIGALVVAVSGSVCLSVSVRFVRFLCVSCAPTITQNSFQNWPDSGPAARPLLLKKTGWVLGGSVALQGQHVWTPSLRSQTFLHSRLVACDVCFATVGACLQAGAYTPPC